MKNKYLVKICIALGLQWIFQYPFQLKKRLGLGIFHSSLYTAYLVVYFAQWIDIHYGIIKASSTVSKSKER